jgi:hypothetical protein
MADAGNRELDLDSVRATFPGWRIGGAPGNWYAFRGGLAALDGPWSLLRRHLRADTLMALAEQLCLQEYLDSLSDQELAEDLVQLGGNGVTLRRPPDEPVRDPGPRERFGGWCLPAGQRSARGPTAGRAVPAGTRPGRQARGVRGRRAVGHPPSPRPGLGRRARWGTVLGGRRRSVGRHPTRRPARPADHPWRAPVPRRRSCPPRPLGRWHRGHQQADPER